MGRSPFWKWPHDQVIDWLYMQLVDELCTGGWEAPRRSVVLDLLDKQLLEPFLLTEATFGTGPSAEEATKAWETRFPAARG